MPVVLVGVCCPRDYGPLDLLGGCPAARSASHFLRHASRAKISTNAKLQVPARSGWQEFHEVMGQDLVGGRWERSGRVGILWLISWSGVCASRTQRRRIVVSIIWELGTIAHHRRAATCDPRGPWPYASCLCSKSGDISLGLQPVRKRPYSSNGSSSAQAV